MKFYKSRYKLYELGEQLGFIRVRGHLFRWVWSTLLVIYP